MKKLIALATVAMFIGSMAFAAESENKEEATVDTSKNPITGTKTTTKKYAKKMKKKNGAEAEVEVTEKTKAKKDGTVETSTDVEADSTTK